MAWQEGDRRVATGLPRRDPAVAVLSGLVPAFRPIQAPALGPISNMTITLPQDIPQFVTPQRLILCKPIYIVANMLLQI